MKFIKIIYFLLIASQIGIGMQKAEFSLDKPYFDSKKLEYVIEAFSPEQKKIGWVIYSPTTDRKWLLRELFVDSDYRKKGVGKDLLQKCIEKVKEYQGSQLSWQVYPKTIGMTEEQLIVIYYRMLKKIDPLYFSKTINEYRGSEYCLIPWMILNLE